MDNVGLFKKKWSNKSYVRLDCSAELRASYANASVTGGCLVGKNVLITGATGDIGSALCYRFLVEGCNVYLGGRNREKL